MPLANFGVLIVLIALLFGFLGIISPKLAIFWGNSKTRGKVLLYYGLLAVTGFVVVVAFGKPSEQKDTKTDPQVAVAVSTKETLKLVSEEELQAKNKADAEKALAEQVAKEAENQKIISEIKQSSFDTSLASRMQATGKLANEQAVIEYYKAAKKKSREIMAEVEHVQVSIKEQEATVAALTGEQSRYVSEVKEHLNAQLINKAADTIFGSKVESDLIISNRKIDKIFKDDFDIRTIKVYAFFSEPLFDLPIQVEVFEINQLKPDNKEVLRVNSNYGGLKLTKIEFFPRKSYKKGTVMDSKVFDF